MTENHPLLDAFEVQNKQIADLVWKLDQLQLEAFAYRGADRGARSAVEPLSGVTMEIRSLERQLSALVKHTKEMTLPILQEAQRRVERRRWLKYVLMAAILFVCLLVGFVGGLMALKSGELMRTVVGCEYVGGDVIEVNYGKYNAHPPRTDQICSFLIQSVSY